MNTSKETPETLLVKELQDRLQKEAVEKQRIVGYVLVMLAVSDEDPSSVEVLSSASVPEGDLEAADTFLKHVEDALDDIRAETFGSPPAPKAN